MITQENLSNSHKKPAIRKATAKVTIIAKDKFWTYDSGTCKLDEGKLYNFLFMKGYKYFVQPGEKFKFIFKVVNNKADDFYFDKLWRLCKDLIDKEFSSITDEERIKVKEVLKERKQSLKGKKLVQLMNEEIEALEENESKRSLQKFIARSKTIKGDLDDNLKERYLKAQNQKEKYYGR